MVRDPCEIEKWKDFQYTSRLQIQPMHDCVLRELIGEHYDDDDW